VGGEIMQEKRDWEKYVEEFSPRVREYFYECLGPKAWEYINELPSCQSPIEELFYIALKDNEERIATLADRGMYNINQQEEIGIGDDTYRVDFLLCAICQGVGRKVVVECDGHDFHEKTKEQAAKDKQRDRTLTKHGYTVVRFTGSEIWDNPCGCANEAIGILFSR
jgi:very-short-patch-repair endonuclease